jgi:hypothetical protein
MKKNPNLWQKYFNKAVEYYKNARVKLRGLSVEYNHYKDAKMLQESAGLCWLAVLSSLQGFFVSSGILPKNMPKSADGYGALLSKFKHKDGKLMKAFWLTYYDIHQHVYYEGNTHVLIVKEGFQRAKFVIEKLTRIKL